jgi:Arc/MetJ-type ribon-helix-helix transcriptional regulator
MPLGQRKQSEMKPTPRSARMGAMADALMAARDWADKAKIPEAVPLLGGQGLGSLVLGKAPEELTEMSYGNMPVRINPLAGRTASYVPEIKPGRKEQVADLAMLAGTPKVGKAGLGLAGGVSDVERAAIAYHGTPHRFAPEPDLPLGRFRSEKIGSGEGAQAFGYGTYFAEAPGTAKGYQEKLSGSNPNVFLLGDKEVSIVGGSPEWKKFNEAAKAKGFSTESSALAYHKLKESKGDLDLASGELTWIDNPTKIQDDAANLLRSLNYKPQGGSFYTVDIPDGMVGRMLDWDKPLKDQPTNVKKALEPLAKQFADERNTRRVSLNKQNPERMTHPVVGKLANKEVKADDIKGSELYEFATQLNKKPEPKPSWTSISVDTDTRAWSGQQATSAYLKDLGIPGIRYFDRQSRDVKEGTRNIVVFPGEESKVKILKRDGDETKMAKGGMMARNIPGFQEGGANVDPVSGNEVPTGSMPEEVRDDIDAKLSPGEFVLPADVVRFIGLERLMKMRDEAKKGLQRMSDIGQMGNADEVGEASNGTYEDAGFESEIDDILGEIEAEENGRDVNEQTEVMMAEGGVAVGTKTNQTTTAGRPVYRTAEGDNVSELSITVPFKGFWANVPSIHNGVKYDEDQIVEMLDKGKIKPTSVHESIKEAVDAAKARSAGLLDKPEMSQGGFMKSGTDLTKAPKNPVFDVRYYKNAEGSVMYITHINGKPMTPIPEGYKAVTQEEAQKVGQKAEEAAKAETPKLKTDESGDADTTLNKEVEKFLDKEAATPGARDARMGKVSNVLETIAKWTTPYGTVRNVMDFLKGPQRTDEEAKQIPIEQRTGVPVENIRNAEIASTTAYQRASELGLDEVAKNEAGQAAATFARSGMDAQTAARTAVEEQQNLRDIEANQGESSVGTPTSGEPDYTSPRDARDSPFADTLAKGGLVNKRQYPTKKKRGKGIASAKT